MKAQYLLPRTKGLFFFYFFLFLYVCVCGFSRTINHTRITREGTGIKRSWTLEKFMIFLKKELEAMYNILWEIQCPYSYSNKKNWISHLFFEINNMIGISSRLSLS